MERLNEICTCTNGWTAAQKKQADAIAGGSFEKILVELQILRTAFSEKKRNMQSGNRFENARASDIRDIFFLNQKKDSDLAPSIAIAEIFSPTRPGNLFETSRASDIRDIFFLQQSKLKDSASGTPSEPPSEFLKLTSDSNFTLQKLQDNPNRPVFLEKKFSIFGPTILGTLT